MKSTARKILNLFFVVTIPASILMGCQEDIQDPIGGTPKKGKIIISPGEDKG